MASISKRTIRWTTQNGEARSTEKYDAVYRDRNGRRHRRSFTLKKDAQRWIDEQTAGLVTGQWVDPQAGRETVQSYAQRWLKRQVLADSTAAAYAAIVSKHILPTLGDMRMEALNREDVQLLVKDWHTSAAARTVEARYTILAIMLRAAVKDRVIPVSPCVDIKLPKIAAQSALVPHDERYCARAARGDVAALPGFCDDRRWHRHAPGRVARSDTRPDRTRLRDHPCRPPTGPYEPCEQARLGTAQDGVLNAHDSGGPGGH